MSGLDETKNKQSEFTDIVKCSECDGTNFTKVIYGHKIQRVSTDSDAFVPVVIGSWQITEHENWQCTECYTIPNDELKDFIKEMVLVEEQG